MNIIDLQDVIENDDIHLDTMFKLSLAVDICQVRIVENINRDTD